MVPIATFRYLLVWVNGTRFFPVLFALFPASLTQIVWLSIPHLEKVSCNGDRKWFRSVIEPRNLGLFGTAFTSPFGRYGEVLDVCGLWGWALRGDDWIEGSRTGKEILEMGRGTKGKEKRSSGWVGPD